jgi:tetratricopeptide (TPR) repeat protein
MLVKTSLEYLDALAGETGGDPALLYEIAVAYRNVGNIQGQPGSANQGDLAASIGNFEKSGKIFTELERMKPNDIAIAREHRKLAYALTRAYFLVADGRWRAEMAKTIGLSGRISSAPGASAADRTLLPIARIERIHLESSLTGRSPEHEAAMAEEIAALEAIVREAPGDVELRERLAAIYQRAGMLLAYTGRTPQSVQGAIAYFLKARDLALEARAQAPGDASKQALVGAILYELAMAQRLGGDAREADRTMVEAIALSRELADRDPSNVTLVEDRMRVLAGASHLAIQVGDPIRATRYSREALAIAERLPERSRKSRDTRVTIANAQAGLGYALLASAGPAAGDRDRRLAMLREARLVLAHAGAFLAAMRAENLGAIPDDEAKNFEEKVKRCDEAIARLEAA